MKFLSENDKHSINRLNVLQYGGVLIECKKAIKKYYYNIKNMLKEYKND